MAKDNPSDIHERVLAMTPQEREARIRELEAKRRDASDPSNLTLTLTMRSSDVAEMIRDAVEEHLGAAVREVIRQEVAKQANVVISSRFKRPAFRALVAEIVTEALAERKA